MSMNIDVGGNAIIEASITDLSAKKYGKKSFTADGISRLVVRVQTSSLGSVTFPINGNIGAQIKSLTDRANLTGTNFYVNTTLQFT